MQRAAPRAPRLWRRCDGYPGCAEPEQLVQAGAEIIGRDDADAVAEIILAGVLGLQKAGIKALTLDLGLPHLAELLLGESLDEMDSQLKDQLFEAINNRDISALTALPIAAAPKVAEMMMASGASTEGLRSLVTELEEEAAAKLDSLLQVADKLAALLPDVAITLDPLDMQGFGYHTSISFSPLPKACGDCQGRGLSHRL